MARQTLTGTFTLALAGLPFLFIARLRLDTQGSAARGTGICFGPLMIALVGPARAGVPKFREDK